MKRGVKVPAWLTAVNDKGDALLISVGDKAIIEKVIRQVSDQDVLLPLAERHLLPEGVVSLSVGDSQQVNVAGGSLCVNPRANEWWIEGMESREGGCFFLSDIEKIAHEVAA